RNAAMDKPWEALAQSVAAKPPFLQSADFEIFDQNIGPFEEAEDGIPPLFRCQIEDDAALIAVDGKKICGGAINKGRPPRPRFIANRRLDLDNVRAVIAKNLRTIRATQDAAQVHDGNAR